MSRFVSAADNEAGASKTEADEAWLAAQARIDATKREKTAAQQAGLQEGGKSLYETLQANKAAKQEAFEEATRLRNQFRSLDEDEVDFLEGVLAESREKEKVVKQETLEQLEAFRKRREEAEKAAKDSEGGVGVQEEETVEWKVGPRKRKKGKEVGGLAGLKVRRRESIGAAEVLDGRPIEEVRGPATNAKEGAEKSDSLPESRSVQQAASEKAKDTIETKAKTTPAPSLGLAAYSSDEDD